MIESLGYGALWGYEYNNGIGIFTEEYLINSDEWINYQEMLNILERYSRNRDLKISFEYVESTKAVRRAFGYPGGQIYYFATVIINDDVDKIYIKKSELDSYFANELGGVPP